MEHNDKNYNVKMSFEDVMGPTFDDIFGPSVEPTFNDKWMLLINN